MRSTRTCISSLTSYYYHDSGGYGHSDSGKMPGKSGKELMQSFLRVGRQARVFRVEINKTQVNLISSEHA